VLVGDVAWRSWNQHTAARRGFSGVACSRLAAKTGSSCHSHDATRFTSRLPTDGACRFRSLPVAHTMYNRCCP